MGELEALTRAAPAEPNAWLDEIYRLAADVLKGVGPFDLDDLAKALSADFSETSHFHTVAGLVLHEVGRLPTEGDVFQIGGYRVEVIDMDDRRIDKLLFTKLADPDEPSLADILSS